MTELLLGTILALGVGFAVLVVLLLQGIRDSLTRLSNIMDEKPAETEVPMTTGDGHAQTGVQLAEDDGLWSRYAPRPGEERR